jgi:hypothetical protein
MLMVEVFEPGRGSDESLPRIGLVHNVPILITICNAAPLFEMRADELWQGSNKQWYESSYYN